MAGSPAARTATNPMVQVAIEQYEPPMRRLVDDDAAAAILPRAQRVLVRMMRSNMLRRLVIAASERTVPGSWAIITCRKRFIDEKLAAGLADVGAVVILGAGMDTRGVRLAPHPVFELDQPVNIARKRAAIERGFGAVPPSLHLVPVDFERDDLTAALAAHGYPADTPTFFVWEGVTQYLTQGAVRATLDALRAAPEGSRLAFTYVRDDFLDGRQMYGAKVLYRRFVAQRIWRFGLDPAAVATFIAPYGWRLVEQAGPEFYECQYIRPTGRVLAASPLEWSAFAVKEHRRPPRDAPIQQTRQYHKVP